MELIGQQETARRERDARMAKAAADQEAAVREAEAEQVKINAARDVSLRRAETETQTAAAQARAAQAGPLAEAEATQEVTRKQTELAELEAARKQKELLTSTVRPAEAEAEAQIRRAEGEKGARIAAGPGRSRAGQARRLGRGGRDGHQGRGAGPGRRGQRRGEAQRTTLEGNAEAGITFTKGEAEAKALALRAEAYRQFNEAAIIQTVLSMLPEIVRAAAEPLANIDTLTVLSNDGASDVVKNVTRTVTEANATVKGLTGIDIPALLNKALGTTRRRAAVGRRHEGGARPATARHRAAARPAGGPGGATSGGPAAGASSPRLRRGRGRRGGRRAPQLRGRRARRRPAPARPRHRRRAAEAPPPRFETPEAVDAAMADADRGDPAAGDAAPTTAADGHGRPARRGPAVGRHHPRDDGRRGRPTAGLGPARGARHRALRRRSGWPSSRPAGPRPLRTMWRVAREQLDAALRRADDRRAHRPLRRRHRAATAWKRGGRSTTGGGEFARLLAENERYAEAFDRSALTAAPLSGWRSSPAWTRRLDVEEALGLRTGDAHIIRNAGGLATDDVIRSLIVSQQLLGTDEIVVIGHTGCGLLGATTRTFANACASRPATRHQPSTSSSAAFDDLGAQPAGAGRPAARRIHGSSACPSTA